ncbi:TatD family hydrolase [Gammaproteobacteria bacterium]|nr:TatD family hydrolase [Gammaproteobacteria bacterium]
MAGFIDIACNFTHDSFKHNLDEVLNNAEQAGVDKFVLLCASLADIDPIKVIKSNTPEKFFISAGIHPHHATEILEINYDALFNKLKSINPNAIGETGLDYFRNISPPDIQKKSFGMHIEIAKELNLPLYLHQRDAHSDFIRIIKENIINFPKFVVHCFTGTQVELDEYLELGAYIGLTGWICDAKRNIDLRKSIKSIPIEKMMIETDSPYLIPKNLMVKPKKNINEPKYLPHIANEICELTGYELEELKLATSNNAIKFFS